MIRVDLSTPLTRKVSPRTLNSAWHQTMTCAGLPPRRLCQRTSSHGTPAAANDALHSSRPWRGPARLWRSCSPPWGRRGASCGCRFLGSGRGGRCCCAAVSKANKSHLSPEHGETKLSRPLAHTRPPSPLVHSLSLPPPRLPLLNLEDETRHHP